MKRLAVMVVFLALVAGCSGIKSKVLTQDNVTQVTAEVEKAKEAGRISEDDANAFAAFAALATMRKTLIGDDILTGKTVGQAIKDAYAFREKLTAGQRQEQEEAKALAEKQNMVSAELLKFANVIILTKKFLKSDFMHDRPTDQIIFDCEMENPGDKDVRAFRGKIQFFDLFGDMIYESNVKVDTPMTAQSKSSECSIAVEYNQFREDAVRLRNADLGNIKWKWQPIEILFADGTRVSIPE